MGSAPVEFQPQVTEVAVQDVARDLGEAKAFLGEALELMVQCYDGEAANNSRLSAVRTNVSKSVLLYRDLHLALSKEVVSDMKGIFSIYDDLSEADFKADIAAIANAVADHARNARALGELNVHLLQEMEGHKRNAFEAVATLEADSKEADQKRLTVHQETEVQVGHHSARVDLYGDAINANLAIGTVLGVATLGLTAPITYGIHEAAKWKQTEHEGIKTTVKEKGDEQEQILSHEGELALVAKDKIKDQLVVSLMKFTEAISKVSGFFEILQTDVQRFADLSEKGSLNKSVLPLYYRSLKKSCGTIKGACDEYLKYDPIARAKIERLEQLESFGNGRNHALQWYQKHKTEYNLVIQKGRVTVEQALLQ